MNNFFKKLFLYAGLREMRFFILFLIFSAGLSVINFIYLSSPLNWISAGIFSILGIVIFWNSLSLAKVNLRVRIETNQLKSIISSLQDGVIVYDADFKILVFNAAAERILNLKKEELLNRYLSPQWVKEPKFRMLAQVIFPSLAQMFSEVSDPGSFPQISDLSLGEGIEFRVVTDRIMDPRGELLGFVKIVHDRSREVALLKSQNEFITVAAHQLRTPLNGIYWAFETLEKESLAPPILKIVKDGLDASSRMLKVVNDMLDVSKIEEGRFGYEFRKMDLAEFISSVLEEMQETSRRYNIPIVFRRPADNIEVFIDPNRLKIALLNLLDNAIKYNVENGKVVVGIKKLAHSPFVEVSVKDTGIGIPSEDINKMFTKFFRAENAEKFITEGSGLGLYIVKNIVRSHGGEVKVESELNRGSVFYFTLPTEPGLVPPKEAAVIY